MKNPGIQSLLAVILLSTNCFAQFPGGFGGGFPGGGFGGFGGFGGRFPVTDEQDQQGRQLPG